MPSSTASFALLAENPWFARDNTQLLMHLDGLRTVLSLGIDIPAYLQTDSQPASAAANVLDPRPCPVSGRWSRANMEKGRRWN